MAQRRVLIVEGDHLPSAGVRSLLSKQENIQVLATAFTDFEEILKVIDAFRPDVIIMFEDVLEKSVWALAASHKEYPSLRTIIVHWDDNEIQIHDSQKVVIREIEDFLAVI